MVTAGTADTRCWTVKFWFDTYTENTAKQILGFIGDTVSASSLTSDIPIDLTDTLSLNVRIEGHGIENYLQDNNSNFYSFTVPITRLKIIPSQLQANSQHSLQFAN